MDARIAAGGIACAYCCHPGISHQWITVDVMGKYESMDISTGCNVASNLDDMTDRCKCRGFKRDIEQKKLI